MKLEFSAEEEQFRDEISSWLETHLSSDEFAPLRFRGGPGEEHLFQDERKRWELVLGSGGWIGCGWPVAHGGRGLSLPCQVIYHEEYARLGGPGRVGHIGETLLAPTLIAFGSEAQQQRYLPGIRAGEELWCQGYSEPGAGSDLAAVRTRARLDQSSAEWRIDGQKTWTSLAQDARYIFLLARCESGSEGSRGLCYLLVEMDQPGIEVRPIRQLTGTSEFNEVFFDGARTAAANIVGAPGEGWKIAMATLGFERGVSTLGQQMSFANDLSLIIETAKKNGTAKDAAIRQRIARAWASLRIMRYNALRMLSGSERGLLSREAMISKLFWASWRRDLGELAMDVLGAEGEFLEGAPYDLSRLQNLYLFSRADTIYAGSNQIQRNIIAERALGMPREEKPAKKRSSHDDSSA